MNNSNSAHMVCLHYEDKQKDKKLLSFSSSLEEALLFCCGYIFSVLAEDIEKLKNNKFKLEILEDIIQEYKQNNFNEVVNMYNTEFRAHKDDPFIVIISYSNLEKDCSNEAINKSILTLEKLLPQKKENKNG